MIDLPIEEEFEYWTEMLEELDSAIRHVRKTEGNIDRSRYINEMKLYNDQYFRLNLFNLKGAFAIARSYLLDVRNEAQKIRLSTQTANKEGSE